MVGILLLIVKFVKTLDKTNIEIEKKINFNVFY